MSNQFRKAIKARRFDVARAEAVKHDMPASFTHWLRVWLDLIA